MSTDDPPPLRHRVASPWTAARMPAAPRTRPARSSGCRRVAVFWRLVFGAGYVVMGNFTARSAWPGC